MSSTDRRAIVAGGLTAGLGLGGARAIPTPRRIVSLNPCLDVILAHVADRGRIAALSHWSRDPYGSTIAEVARTLPFTWGTTEEVIALSPDLVITGRPAPVATIQTLARLGIRTLQFPVPETVAASLAQVREIATLVGRPERGEAMVARIEAALAAAAPAPGTRRVDTLVFMPGGFASGPGTLMDEMMTRTGLTNIVGRYGLGFSANVPLERVIADPPELLLSGEPTRGAPSRAERMMRHPALARIAGRMRQAEFPERLLFCGGPVLIRTAATLARARDTALARRA